MGVAVDFLARRVRRFSSVMMVMSPLVALYNFYLFVLGGAVNNHSLGFGIASLAWGATFIYPRKLAHESCSNKQKLASYLMFGVALISCLIWFPLNDVLTKPSALQSQSIKDFFIKNECSKITGTGFCEGRETENQRNKAYFLTR